MLMFLLSSMVLVFISPTLIGILLGIVLPGLMTPMFAGICKSFTLMFVYGLCFSGLFCLGNISKERLSQLKLFINKSPFNFMP